jgi:ligand-binding sensor domain-containing protein/signal transduction histidine kinase
MLPYIVSKLKNVFVSKRTFSFSLLLLFIFCLAPKNSAQYQFDVWNSENGLPQNSVNGILQTRDGYLWFATFDGLVRYDGERLTIFDRGNTEGIVSNRFSALFEDRESNLWIGTEDGLLTTYQDGKFLTYTKDDGLLGAQIYKIEDDEDGRLWLVTGAGCTLWEKGRATHYEPKQFASAMQTGWGRVSNLWWCEDAAGLQIIRHGRVMHYSKPKEIASLHIKALYEDQHRNIWIRTTENILIKLKDEQFIAYPLNSNFPRYHPSVTVCEDRRGNLWVETYVVGEHYDRISRLKNAVLTHYVQSFGVTTIYEDREGTIWIGTFTGGFYRVREEAITTFTEKDGLSSNNVYSVFEDSAGTVWIGTWGGGLNQYKNGKITRYLKDDGLFSNRITTIFEDRQGVLWIGANGGVSRFKNGRLTKFTGERGLFNVWAMCEDRAGNLWFGTDAGLIGYRDGSFTTYTTKDGLPETVVSALLEDRAGNLWIGTFGGLARFANGEFTAFTVRDGLSSKRIRSLYEDRDGTLWIGSYDSGLTRFKDRNFTRYTTKEGLFNNGVFQILEDDRGNFWMSCNKGIYRASRQELNDFADGKLDDPVTGKRRSVTSVPYSTKDGLLVSECNGGRQPAGWKMRDGRLWFPTMGGVAILDPREVRINNTPPPVMIEQVRLNNEPIELRPEIRIPPGTDNLEIHYVGLSFIKPEQVKFKYKLEGSDKDWIEAGDRRAAYYNYIPPGEYTFKVIAANSDGVWNTEGKCLRIVALSPFWRTWWFLSVVIISVVGAAVLVYKRRVAQLQKEKTLQENFSKQLIDSQESERERVAEDLHHSLGQDVSFIKTHALMALQNIDGDERNNERLNDILSLAGRTLDGIREIAYNLRPYQLDKLGLLKTVEATIKRASRSSGILFYTDLESADDILSKDAVVCVYRIIQESVNNIIKHSQATQARVTIKKDALGIEIVIADNGKGFAQIATASSKRQGFGLVSIAERARILGGKYTMESAPEKGTTVRVKIGLKGITDEG